MTPDPAAPIGLPGNHWTNCACGRSVFVLGPPNMTIYPEAWCQVCIDDGTAPYGVRINRELEIAEAIRNAAE
jgi:hypothetical protein